MTDALARLEPDTPADIHLVIDTHLHGDHAGGNTCYDEAGKVVASRFRMPSMWYSSREYEDAMHVPMSAHVPLMFPSQLPAVGTSPAKCVCWTVTRKYSPGITGHMTRGVIRPPI